MMDKATLKANTLEAIDKMYDEVDKMKQGREGLNNKIRQNLDKQMENLNKRKADLQAKLKALEEASEENLEEAKSAYSKSMEHFKAGFSELKNIFNS